MSGKTLSGNVEFFKGKANEEEVDDIFYCHLMSYRTRQR